MRCRVCRRDPCRCDPDQLLLLDIGDYDADELGIDPDARWYDIEHQGFLIGSGKLDLPPTLPRTTNA